MSSGIPPQLIEAFASHRAALFVGAGVSIAAGLPNWKNLMEALKPEIEDLPNEELSPLDLAQYYLNDHHEQRLAEKLSQILDRDDVQPTEVHKILVRLPVTRIYTTNFDRLLERACVEGGRKCQAIANAGKLAIAKQDRLNIVKLHGDFDDPESLVIAAEDFEDYFQSHAALAHRIASEMRENTVLFVGYSFNDPDLRTILRAIRNESDGYPRNHFILQLNPKRPTVKELERRGLKVIELDTTGNPKAVLEWFRRLESRVREEMPPVSERPTENATHNLPNIPTDLVGRDEDFTAILKSVSTQSVVAITGAPGVGKTSLAVKIGHACAKRIPPHDFRYVVWLTGRDKPGQQYWLNGVLDTIGMQLGFPVITQQKPDQLEKKKTQVELLLRSHRTLIILDNFDTMSDPALLEWIQTVPQESRVLLTARTDLGGVLRAGGRYMLEGLSTDHALLLLRRYAQEAKTVESLRVGADSWRLFVEATCGNPQAMKLALGVVLAGSTLNDVVNGLGSLKKDIDAVFEQLFIWTWEKLSYDAERLLLTAPLFSGGGRIRREALQASTGFTGEIFEAALGQVLQFGLLEAASKEGHYFIHPKTRSFVLEQLKDRSKFADQARERCAKYYLDFVESNVVRSKPEIRYWNALVTENMKAIDEVEWLIIRELMDWASQSHRNDLLIRFVMLLVHYMDSRFLNRERLEYVSQAVKALSETSRLADEALLRIDALGWTYVEESSWEQAHDQIDRGHTLAKRVATDEKVDLVALANAWKARALIEEEKQAEADSLIGEAVREIARCSPWIRVRVNMAAGDIALKEHRNEDALTYFMNASEAAKEYGGEGGGYQIDPRIGLAFINLGRVDEAEVKFQSLRDLEGIPIGNLYGDYGLALVAYKRGNVQDAEKLLQKARHQLELKATSNLLWTLLNDLYAKLHK